MADTSNLSNFLEDVADAIRTKKETTEKIPAANFDTEILSITTGIDTSDATATPDDILNPVSAYLSDGEKHYGEIMTKFKSIGEGLTVYSYLIEGHIIRAINTELGIAIVGDITSKTIDFYKWENHQLKNLIKTINIADYITATDYGQCLYSVDISKTLNTHGNITVWFGDYYYVCVLELNPNTLDIIGSAVSNLGTRLTDIKMYHPMAINPTNADLCGVIYSSENDGYDTYHEYTILLFTYDSNTKTVTRQEIYWQVQNGKKRSPRLSWDQTGKYLYYGVTNLNNATCMICEITSAGTITSIYKTANEAKTIGMWNNEYMFFNNTLVKVSDRSLVKTYDDLVVTIESSILWTNEDYLFHYNNNDALLDIYHIDDITFELTKVNSRSYNFGNRIYGNLYEPITGNGMYIINNSGELLYFSLINEDKIATELKLKGYVLYNTYDSVITNSQAISGSIYYDKNGRQIGTMPNNGELNYDVSTSEQTIPAGYTSGGTIEAARQTNEDYDGCLELAQQILYGGIITNYPLDNAAHYWIFEYNGNIYCAKHTKDVPSIGYENGVQENLVWYTMSFEILTLYKFINGAYTTSYETSDTDIVMRSSGSARVFDDGVNIKSLYSDIDLLYDGYWTQQLGTNYYFKANPVN